MPMRQNINDMVTRNGKASNTKFWAFVAYAVATWIMIYMTLKDKMTWDLFVVYLGTVGGVSQVSKFIAYKYGGSGSVSTIETSSSTVVKCPDCATATVTKTKKDDEGSD